MTALIVIAVIALLFAALLSLRIRVRIRYDGTLFVGVQILRFRIPILPAEQAPKQEQQAENEVQHDAERELQAVEKGALSAREVLELMRTLVPVAWRGLVKKIVFPVFRLYIKVAAGDAAQAAIQFGGLNALLYPLVALLGETFTLRERDLRLSVDFTASHYRVYFETEFYLRIWRILVTALVMLVKYLALRRRQKRQRVKAV
ncbi:DUF2953 domain-containing protein [Feifania hominis]|uniref:DUF2953 domain-containing protein n=1 Tax=Feifania hominis TaxID=2763660 RepID=A0A926HTP7_9FIRM|nr:DUF2953 domain-containing protein [Feifania hominis]MBC8535518.1 DUF2953 domain-containing protein [Feifania hominis]